jgi:hypothetical protein
MERATERARMHSQKVKSMIEKESYARGICCPSHFQRQRYAKMYV